MNDQPNNSMVLVVAIAGGLLVLFSIALLLVFFSASNATETGIAEEAHTADTYVAEVSAVLANADPANGEVLLTQYGCVACHLYGVENGLAPSFVGLNEYAVERHPPLTAEAYVYESILYPTAFEVEGYSGQMPQTYGNAIPDEDLGDMIAYLLSDDVNELYE